MWFRDRTPKIPAQPDLFYIRLRSNARVEEVVADSYGLAVRERPDDPSWFVFLLDGEVVFRIAEHGVMSIERVEPEMLLFDIECGCEPATKPAENVVTKPFDGEDFNGVLALHAEGIVATAKRNAKLDDAYRGGGPLNAAVASH